MEWFKEYLLQNWALILILTAFVVMQIITVFLDRKTKRRMYILIGAVFALSFVTFFEYQFSLQKIYPDARKVLLAIRYSATPIILALILFTLVKKARWYVLIPSLLLAIINIISIFTGIVFSIDPDSGNVVRGALGYLPYIGVGLYSVFLVYILIRQSNKQPSEIIPIAFLALTFATGLIFPFFMGKDYSKIFTSTIGIGLFVYYGFLISQQTKKDSLTGLLNRQAFYASIENTKDITAIVSIDMNGLKTINDTEGHAEGDEALVTLALCFLKPSRAKQKVYRIGGDEFIIICRKTAQDELERLIANIRRNVSKTKYSCSIGYSYSNKPKDIEAMIKESDEMMYLDKAKYYSDKKIDRRTH